MLYGEPLSGIISVMYNSKNIDMNSNRIGPFFAYGKINWSLLVTGLREDGYHLLDTVMQRIDLCDELTLYPATQWSVECSEPATPKDVTNTALAAAQAYAEVAGITDKYRIVILKRIPIGAGLGGSSADAAAVLTALNGRYNALSQDSLAELGLNIGADVPFCMVGGCARCKGVGEVMEPLAAGEYHLVVAGCGAKLTTARVFKHYDGMIASERGRRSTDAPFFGKCGGEKEKIERFAWEQQEEAEWRAKTCEGEGDCTPCAHPKSGEEMTGELAAALSSNSAEAVAAALKALSSRSVGGDPNRVASVCGDPCDVRYAAEANCVMCAAQAGGVPCAANDLAFATCDINDAIGDTLLSLQRAGAMAVSMSGSGSCCFGLFPSKAAAAEAAAKLSNLPFCIVCSTQSSAKVDWQA